MKFEEVLPLLREGKKVRKVIWSREEYIFLKDTKVKRSRLFRDGVTDVLNEDFAYWIENTFDKWEILQDEIEVADYFITSNHGYLDSKGVQTYTVQTFEIDKAPVGAFIMANSRRKVKK